MAVSARCVADRMDGVRASAAATGASSPRVQRAASSLARVRVGGCIRRGPWGSSGEGGSVSGLLGTRTLRLRWCAVRRSAIPLIVLGATALVALLVYGLLAAGESTTIDDAVARGDRPPAPSRS